MRACPLVFRNDLLCLELDVSAPQPICYLIENSLSRLSRLAKKMSPVCPQRSYYPVANRKGLTIPLRTDPSERHLRPSFCSFPSKANPVYPRSQSACWMPGGVLVLAPSWSFGFPYIHRLIGQVLLLTDSPVELMRCITCVKHTRSPIPEKSMLLT